MQRIAQTASQNQSEKPILELFLQFMALKVTELIVFEWLMLLEWLILLGRAKSVRVEEKGDFS
jgi:hypothetical protein